MGVLLVDWAKRKKQADGERIWITDNEHPRIQHTLLEAKMQTKLTDYLFCSIPAPQNPGSKRFATS